MPNPYIMGILRRHGVVPAAPSSPWAFFDEFYDAQSAGNVNGTLATNGVNTRLVTDTIGGTQLWNSSSRGCNSLASWSQTAGDGAIALDATSPHEGTNSIKLTSGATSNTFVRTATGNGITLVAPGTTLGITFWTRGDGTNAGRYAILDQTNGDADIVALKTTGVASNTWTMVTENIIVPAGCYTVKMKFQCPTVNGGIAWFDDGSAAPVGGNCLIEDGKIVLGGTTINAYDPRLLYDYLVPTENVGQLLLLKVTPTVNNVSGYHCAAGVCLTTVTGTSLPEGSKFIFYNDLTIRYGNSDGFTNKTTGFSYTTDTVYYLAIAWDGYYSYAFIKGGAFTHWTLINRLAFAPTKYNLTPVLACRSESIKGDWIRVPVAKWLPRPISRDQFWGTTTDGLYLPNGAIHNGSFELLLHGDVEGWTLFNNPTNGTMSYDTSIVHGGTRSVKGERTAGDTGTTLASYVLWATYKTVPGHTYRFTGWSRGDGTVDGIVKIGYSPSGLIFHHTGITGTTWAEFSFDYTEPARNPSGNPSVSSFLIALNPPSATGIVYYDDLKWEDITAGADHTQQSAATWSDAGHWTNHGGACSNATPETGEDITNGTFEGTYTGGVAPSWTKVGSPTMAESADAHGGVAAQSLTNSGGSGAGFKQVGIFTQNKFYALSGWFKAAIASRSFFVKRGGSSAISYIAPDNTGYHQIKHSGVIRNGNSGDLLIYNDTTSSTFIFDDFSLKEMAIADMVRASNFGLSDVLVSCRAILPGPYYGGVILNLDDPANPQNFIVVAWNGSDDVAGASGTWVIDKCVSGVITNVASTSSQAIAVPNIIEVKKTGNTVIATINNDSIGGTISGTVSDASIVSNTYHGLISTNPLNYFFDFNVFDFGGGGAWDSTLDAFIADTP